MIKQVEGDILLTRAQVIAHGIAAMDPMNQGLAKSLHEKYPAMHKDFHHWCHQHHPKPGEAWMWGGPDGLRIVNLILRKVDTVMAASHHMLPCSMSIMP